MNLQSFYSVLGIENIQKPSQKYFDENNTVYKSHHLFHSNLARLESGSSFIILIFDCDPSHANGLVDKTFCLCNFTK